MLQLWHKRLILFVAAADLGALAAAAAAQFGLVPHWLGRLGLYRAGDLPTPFDDWAIFLIFIFGFLAGLAADTAPCFLPSLYGFLPRSLRAIHTKTHRGFRRLAVFALGLFLIAVVFGTLLGFLGRFVFDQLFIFTASAGKTGLAVFGLLGILFLVFGLGEFEYLTPIRWLAGFYHRFERMVSRRAGAAQAFLAGLLNGGAFGTGCPYPFLVAFFLVVAALGNVTFAVLAVVCFALGRLAVIFYLTFRELRSHDAARAIAALARTEQSSRTLRGVLLVASGSFLFIFWWVYASFSAFAY